MNCPLLEDYDYMNDATSKIPIWLAQGRKDLSDDRIIWDWLRYNIRAHAKQHSKRRARERNEKENRLEEEYAKAKQVFEADPNNTNSNILNAAKENLEDFFNEKLNGVINARSRSLARTWGKKFSPRESCPSGDCYCRQSTNGGTITCANPECKVSTSYPSVLCIYKLKVPKVWYYLHCRNLHVHQFARPKTKKMPDMKDQYLTEAEKLEKICMCQKKAEPNEKVLKCHIELCSGGRFCHLTCMSHKGYPSNAKTT